MSASPKPQLPSGGFFPPPPSSIHGSSPGGPPAYEHSVDKGKLIKFEVRFLAGPPLNVSMEDSFTMRLLKLQIEDARNTPTWHQTLVCDGKVLGDEDTVGQSGVKNGGFMYCLVVAPQTEKAAVGVPAGSTQIDCPTCGVLIAIPPGMLEFQCPRCDTICQAPPKYEEPPQLQQLQRAKSSKPLLKRGYSQLPQFAQVDFKDKSDVKKAEPSIASTNTTSPDSASSVSSTNTSLSADEQAWLDWNRSDRDKLLQTKSEAELVANNWPYGQTQFWVRAFWLVQCVVLSLFWYFDILRREPRDVRYAKYKNWLPIFNRNLSVRSKDQRLLELNNEMQMAIDGNQRALWRSDIEKAADNEKVRGLMRQFYEELDRLEEELKRQRPEDQDFWKPRVDQHKLASEKLHNALEAGPEITFTRFTVMNEAAIPSFIYWSDTDRARNGMIWGWVFFFCWSPFYVWMLMSLLNVNLYAAILSIIFGPLILLPMCWSINNFCDACLNSCGQCCEGCNGGGNGDCNCYCNCSGNGGGGDSCNCDCDCCHGCGNCDCNCCDGCANSCADCCSGIGDCCSGCGDCNCSGCDCGGCDC